MIKIFEGKNEQEAIQLAAADLGLTVDEFEVEIIDTEQKKGIFFKRPNVKIRVHYEGVEKKIAPRVSALRSSTSRKSPVVSDEIEIKSINFLEQIIDYMGINGSVSVGDREDGKFTLNIISEYSSILIGKKGKTLDALQLLLNVYITTFLKDDESLRVIIDAEDYRGRREEAITKMAQKNADIVAHSKSSRLMEPMNPFERRLIHTALNGRDDVITQSEGEGLYKQVRIIYKGSR